MIKFDYVIQDEVGMHARPAGALVKFVTELTSTVTLQKGEKTVDANRLFGIMGLGVKQNDVVTFILEGDLEETEKDALEKFCKENF